VSIASPRRVAPDGNILVMGRCLFTAAYRFMSLTTVEMERLRELVMICWDPVGVHLRESTLQGRACYWNEYDSYLPSIVGHLDAGDDVEWLAEYLASLRTENMGLSPQPDLDRQAATAIVEWHRRTRAD
jgi:hypothetical protein